VRAEFFPHSDTAKVETLPPVYVYHWKNKKDYRNYRRTVYNLKKVYPYAKIAKNKLAELNAKYQSGSNKEKKEIVKTLEKELFSEFEAPLKNLTVSQGRMLIKLIDRETGKTSYSVLKEFKGGFKAVFWQGVARLFGNNLKSEYDKYGEDKILEELVLTCEDGTFEQIYYSMFAK
jgi:protein subunit release factor A